MDNYNNYNNFENSNNISYQKILIIILICVLIICFLYFITNFTINQFTSSSIENVNKLPISPDNKLDNKLDNDAKNKTISLLEKNMLDLQLEINSIKNNLDSNKISTININSGSGSGSNSDNENFQIPVNPVNLNSSNVVVYDPIANYDILKLQDPLVDPRGRSSADEIPTPQVAAQLNFPTQGILDRYHRIGLLIALDHDNGNGNYTNIKPNRNDLNETTSYWDNHSNRSGTNLSNSSNNSGSLNSQAYKGVDILQNNTFPKTKFDNKLDNKLKRKSRGREGFSDDLLGEDSGVEIGSSNIMETFETFGNLSFGSDSYSKSNDKSNSHSNSHSNSDSDSDSSNNKYNNKYNKYNKSTKIYNNYVGDTPNDILELIGKKQTQNWYKYFTSISKGNKIIKIVVHNRNRRELYDGDIIYIPELHKSYRVKLDELDMIDYNPYFF
jgi:hypothetical protein